MQTFLPYPDFIKSAAVLDRQRLGKQRVENLQIIKALNTQDGLHGGWSRHPASRMWRGHEAALFAYQKAVCKAWTSYGYKDTCLVKSYNFLTPEQKEEYESGEYELPDWFGNEDFHKAHQSNLVRKSWDFYHNQFPGVPDDLPYIWPGLNLKDAKLEAKV